MQRWLARLTFSFFIVAAVLLYDVYGARRGFRPALPEWRLYTELGAAVVLILLGIAGVRQRHRQDH